jgi:DNA adenine methylase
VNSFLRWAGSKRKLLPILRPFWRKEFSRYVEPFAGSACLFFALEPESAVLGDINPDLMNMYRCVKRDPDLVVQCLNRLNIGKKHYYKIRAIETNDLTPFEAAGRFLYLNRLCFNGLYRTNAMGHFNVPYCPPGNRRLIDLDALEKGSNLLARTQLVEGDFIKTLETCEKGDFVYMDPPYVVSKRRVFSGYLPHSFANCDLERFEDSLATLDRKGIKFVISYADSTEARRILRHWRPKRILVRRHIAGFTSKRRSGYELLATNIM